MAEVSLKLILNLIKDGKIKQAFDLVNQILDRSPGKEEIQHEIIVKESDYALQKTLFEKRLITSEDFRANHNQIVNALLSIIQENNLLFPGEHTGEINSAEYYDDILKELAEELAINYFTVSFGERFDNKNNHYLEDIFTEKSLEHYLNNSYKRRNILLIGAGATVSACPYVPTGDMLKMYLEYEYPDLIKEAKLEKKDLDYYPNFDTEKYLAKLYKNLSIGSKEELRTALNRIYDVKYLPIHFYEIVAHMLKHSVFDVIINFNIDELLDEAVFEELGKSDYIKVASSVDCRDLDSIFIDGRLKTPIYIKIHGSASDKSSLRFSDNQHFDVPEDIKKFITKLLRGQMSEETNEEQSKRIATNIVCVGFDPERFDFIKFFDNDTLMPGSKWFHINHQTRPLLEKFGLGQYFSGQKNGNRYERWIPTEHWKPIPVDGRTNSFLPSLGDIFYRLWSVHIRNAFREPFRPRNISRHEIVSDIFYYAFDHHDLNYFENDLSRIEKKYKELKGYFRSAQYSFERTVLEVAISLCKNKGLLEPEQVINERIGAFYKKYKEKYLKEKNQNPVLSPIKTLADIYAIFQLKSDYHYAGDLLNVSRFTEENDGPFYDHSNLIVDLGCKYRDNGEDEITAYFNDPLNLHCIILYRFFKNHNFYIIRKLKERFEHNDPLRKHLFKRILFNANQLRESFTYDIKSRFDDPGVFQFQSLDKTHVLHTNLSLSYQFAEKFNHPKSWDIMLMIGERGKFLTSHFNVIGKKTIDGDTIKNHKMVILACYEAFLGAYADIPPKHPDPAYFEQLKTNFKINSNINYNNIEYLLLPYWQHYQHMVIFLKRHAESPPKYCVSFKAKGQSESWEVVKSFYYFKPGFSNQINPVLFPLASEDEIQRERIRADQTWMLKTFFAYFLMAKTFEKTGNALPIITADSLILPESGDDWFGSLLRALNIYS